MGVSAEKKARDFFKNSKIEKKVSFSNGRPKCCRYELPNIGGSVNLGVAYR